MGQAVLSTVPTKALAALLALGALAVELFTGYLVAHRVTIGVIPFAMVVIWLFGLSLGVLLAGTATRLWVQASGLPTPRHIERFAIAAGVVASVTGIWILLTQMLFCC